MTHTYSPEAYVFGSEENHDLLEAEANELLHFGHNFPAPQGGSYWLDDTGNPDLTQSIHTWITCRMAHVYSLGFLHGEPGAAELVDKAIAGLRGPLHDDENGGWYPSISADGSTHEASKVCYAHAFVILAATSAKLIVRPGADELLEEALATYDKHFWDDEIGLAVDAWNTEFTKLDSYRGINANMHTTEAFLAVADVTGNEEYRERAGHIIDHVVSWASNNSWRIPEHFTADWQPDLECNHDKPDDQFKPYGATPGHGIEWARLITQYALSSKQRSEEGKQQLIEVAENLFTQALSDAWNAEGTIGLAYTTDWNGKPVVTDRMHWTLAESVNTDWYAIFWKYIDEYLIDHENGSWFH